MKLIVTFRFCMMNAKKAKTPELLLEQIWKKIILELKMLIINVFVFNTETVGFGLTLFFFFQPSVVFFTTLGLNPSVRFVVAGGNGVVVRFTDFGATCLLSMSNNLFTSE